MSTSKNRSGSQAARLLAVMVMIPALSVGTVAAQTATGVQGSARRAPDNVTYTISVPQAAWTNVEGAQLPQDIRIMQRIVRTALEEVEAPELPDVLQASAGSSETAQVVGVEGGRATLWIASSNRGFSIGGRDVTGFYMEGYGYLFTLKWRVGPGGSGLMVSDVADARVVELNALVGEARRAATTADAAEARAAGEAEAALEQERARVEERQRAWEEWSAEYRDALAEGLRNVVANYGSTLTRAAPEEAITFIADFGGGEAETVTVSARRGELSGAGNANLNAVQVAKGTAEVSPGFRTQLKIMAEIIDSSLQSERSNDVNWTYTELRYFGGDSSYQYVPGYGVLFRKAARINLATKVIREVNPARGVPRSDVQTFRQQLDESTEEQRQAYTEHLADLKQKTAAVLAVYGATLTEMNDDDWVGVFYDVGPAAGMLEGGISNFLVQARMGDVRQAANEPDGAAWLLDNLVTNEKQD